MIFCIWVLSFSILFLRFICILAWISIQFLSVDKSNHIVWIDRSLCLHSPADAHLNYFHILAITNKAALDTCVHVLDRVDVFIFHESRLGLELQGCMVIPFCIILFFKLSL